jgi:hypothetical protein
MIGVDKLTFGPTDCIGLQSGPVEFSPILHTPHFKILNYVFIKLANAHLYGYLKPTKSNTFY